MNFGNLEKGVFLFVVGMFPFWILIYVNSIAHFKEGEMIPLWYSLMMVIGVFMMFMGVVWIVSKVRGTRAYIMMDEIAPDEIVIIRVTQDGVIVPTVAPKGMFGKAETTYYGNDADIMDDGEFRLRLINGCPVIIAYDLLNMALDLRRSLARKNMMKHVENGPDAYKHWKRLKLIKSGKKDRYEVDDDE